MNLCKMLHTAKNDTERIIRMVHGTVLSRSDLWLNNVSRQREQSED